MITADKSTTKTKAPRKTPRPASRRCHGGKPAGETRTLCFDIAHDDGAPIVRVPLLGKDLFVTVDLDDWHDLVGNGFGGFGGGWVCAQVLPKGQPGAFRVCAYDPDLHELYDVAALLADAGPGELARPADGDLLNLRRKNLRLVSFTAPGQAT